MLGNPSFGQNLDEKVEDFYLKICKNRINQQNNIYLQTTTKCKRRFNVVDVQTTLFWHQNDVVCLLGKTYIMFYIMYIYNKHFVQDIFIKKNHVFLLFFFLNALNFLSSRGLFFQRSNTKISMKEMLKHRNQFKWDEWTLYGFDLLCIDIEGFFHANKSAFTEQKKEKVISYPSFPSSYKMIKL